MGRFCSKHVGERTDDELRERYAQICGGRNSGPGLRAEMVRIDLEADRRGIQLVKNSALDLIGNS